MTQQEFIKELRIQLEKNQIDNVDDILSDYVEHFNHGISKGKSEAEIATALGYPATIAKAYSASSMIKEIKNQDKSFQWRLALNTIIKLIVIAPFNLIVLFIPGVLILSLIVSGWALAASFLASGFFSMSLVPSLADISETAWVWLTPIFAGLGLMGIASITGIIMFLISKYVLLGLINYLQWNIQFITDKK